MRRIRQLASLLALALLSGCVNIGVGRDIENLRGAEAKGDTFTRKLTEEYRRIVLFEADRMYDWRDAGHFARKGLRAADGEAVAPETIESRDLPADHVDELTAAHAELVGLLGANASTKFPMLAGLAQGGFDCWIEQQEENIQPDHIAACRNQFHDSIQALKAAMAPKPVPIAEPAPAPPPPPVAPMAPESFIVYFDFDSTELSAAGNDVLESVTRARQKMDVKSFAVTGHADRTGPEAYNLALSLRRANAVLEVLTAHGINASTISLAGRGETEPMVRPRTR